MGGCTSTAPTPQPLSMEKLLQVQAHLESRRQLTPELQARFNLALSEFSQEPISIQENARMTIQSGSTVLVFMSGLQENEIHIFHMDGQVQYNIKVARWDASVARAYSRMTVKSMEEMVNYVPGGPVLVLLKKMWG